MMRSRWLVCGLLLLAVSACADPSSDEPPDASALRDASATEDAGTQPNDASDASDTPDGDTVDAGDAPYLVFVHGSEVRSVRADSLDDITTLRHGTDSSFAWLESMDYARDGEVVLAGVYTQTGRILYAWYRSAATDEPPFVLVQSDASVEWLGVQVTRDGRFAFVLIVGQAPLIYRLDASGPVQLEHTLEPCTEGTTLIASTDGRHVLYGTYEVLQLVDLEEASAARPIHVDDDSAFQGWHDAQFSPDGSTIVFEIYDETGNSVHVVSLLAARAGEAPRRLALGANTSAHLEHVSERGVFARYDIGGAPFDPESRVLAVYDLEGALIESVDVSPDDNFPAYCGNVALITLPDGSPLFVHDTAGGVELSANAPAIPLAAQPQFGANCDAVVYDGSDDVFYFKVPAPTALPGDVIVHQLAGRRYGRIKSTALGDYVTGVGLTPDPTQYYIWREGQTELTVEGTLLELAFTSDGTRFLYLAPDEFETQPYELFLHSVALTGANRGDDTLLLGPTTQQRPLVFGGDDRYLAMDSIPSLAADGSVVGIDGIAELDLSAAEPEPARLPIDLRRQTALARVVRIPGERAVLVEVEDGPSCGSRLFVHSLEAGAQAIEQPLGSPELTCEQGVLTVSADGEQVAVHRGLRDTHYFGTLTLGIDEDEQPSLETYDAEPHQQMAAFGAERDRLIVYTPGRYGEPASLARIDLALGTSTPVIHQADAMLSVLHVVPQTERVFFALTTRNGASETKKLFVSDVDQETPRELMTTPWNAEVTSSVGASGEWIAVRSDSGRLVVHDEREAWAAHVLTSVHPSDETAQYANASGEGLLLLRAGSAAGYVWERDAFDSPRELQVSASERTAFALTQDQERALFFANVGGETGLFALDFASASPSLERLAAQPAFPNEGYVWVWPLGNDRFALAGENSGDEFWLIGLQGQPTRALPSLSGYHTVDRQGRYLAYTVFDVSSATRESELYVLSLDDPSAEPRWVAPTTGGYNNVTWVD